MTPESIGFIGVGRMGMPMCRNLLAAGHAVTVFNRSSARVEALVREGAVAAPSVAALAAACRVVITCLDSVETTEAIYLGAEGIVAHARAGTLLIDHATIAPPLVRRIAAAASERGLPFLDAPVSGGPEGAAKGTLAIMAGGDATAFAEALPVMRAYGTTVVHMGANGTGTEAKLVNQLLTFVHGAAAAEAIALAERVGLDLESLATVLRASFGHSRMLDRTLDRVVRDDYAAGAALALYEKDLGIMRTLGDELGLALPATDAARAILADALEAGLGDRDIAALRLRYPGAGEER